MSDKNEGTAKANSVLPLAQEMRERAEQAKQRLEEEEREARRQEAIAQAEELLRTDVLPSIEEEATQGRFLATIEIGKTKGALDVVTELARIVSEAGYQTSVVPKYSGARTSNEATDYKGATFCIEW
jgi:hypothetical protein